MTDNEPVLSAYEFDGNGRGNPLPANRQAEAVRSDTTVTWIHLDATHAESRNWLHKNISYLDQLILDALLAEETRPRVIENDQGVRIILNPIMRSLFFFFLAKIHPLSRFQVYHL